MKRSEMENKILSVIQDFFHSNDPKYGFLAEYIMEEVDKHMVPSFAAKHQDKFSVAMGAKQEWDKE